MANNKKSKKKVIIFSILGGLLIVVTLLVILGSKKEPVYTVQTEKIVHRTITQVVTATGKIYPEVEVQITPEVSGEIVALPVKEGMKVHKGDVLLKIKPDIYVAMRDRAAAAVKSALASTAKSQSDRTRAEDLYKKGLISSADLETAKTSYEVAKGESDQAQASLDQSSEDLRKTTIYSPMDGTISERLVELGQRVLGTSQFQGTDVMTVADLSRMEARVDVGENDIVLVHVGDTARIIVDAFPERKLAGVVYEIGNSAKTTGLGTQEEVTNFTVKIRILDKDVVLRPGMSMTATIETQTKNNVLAVPIQCVTTRSPNKEKEQPDQAEEMVTNNTKVKPKVEKPKEVVFLVQNNTAKMVEVKRGISDDSYTEITSGVTGDEEVISGSYKAINRELENGAKLKIDNSKKKPGNV